MRSAMRARSGRFWQAMRTGVLLKLIKLQRRSALRPAQKLDHPSPWPPAELVFDRAPVALPLEGVAGNGDSANTVCRRQTVVRYGFGLIETAAPRPAWAIELWHRSSSIVETNRCQGIAEV